MMATLQLKVDDHGRAVSTLADTYNVLGVNKRDDSGIEIKPADKEEAECDYRRCSCEIAKKSKNINSNGNDFRLATVLRSNSCDSNFLYNFNKLRKLRQSLENREQVPFRYDSKICYCIQLLALSPNTLLRTIQFPTALDRRYLEPKRAKMTAAAAAAASAKKGRSKSVSYTTNEPISSKFRRCNSTIEAPKRRASEMVDSDLLEMNGLAKTTLTARKAQTLYRHYYPEGGWGWTVLVVCVLVSILDHGMQLSAAVLVGPASVKYGVSAVHAAGQYPLPHHIALTRPLINNTKSENAFLSVLLSSSF